MPHRFMAGTAVVVFPFLYVICEFIVKYFVRRRKNNRQTENQATGDNRSVTILTDITSLNTSPNAGEMPIPSTPSVSVPNVVQDELDVADLNPLFYESSLNGSEPNGPIVLPAIQTKPQIHI